MFFIKFTDVDERVNLVNLDYVSGVRKALPAEDTEQIYMAGGRVYTVPVGTFDLAIANLFAQFDDNPQPKENVKDKLFISY